MSSSEDVLFSVKNALYLGAAQTAISDAAQLTGLTDEERVMRDILTHRAYIELGSSEVGWFGGFLSYQEFHDIVIGTTLLVVSVYGESSRLIRV